MTRNSIEYSPMRNERSNLFPREHFAGIVTSLPRAVESRPIPGDISGGISPCCSLSDDSHLVMLKVGHLTVLMCLTILFLVFLAFSSHSFPQASHQSPFPVCSPLATCPTCHKAAYVPLDSSVHSGRLVSSTIQNSSNGTVAGYNVDITT